MCCLQPAGDAADEAAGPAGGGAISCVPLRATRFDIAQIVLGLDAMHSAGFVYRDLKPENVLMDGKGNLKVPGIDLALILSDSLTLPLVVVARASRDLCFDL